MVKVQDAFMTTDAFNFQVNEDGIVQISFGPTHVCMSLDSAFDLQYRLAAFLAHVELAEYPDETAVLPELDESRRNLLRLISPTR